MTIVDQLERSIKLSSTPKRIVSLVPSQTELIWDLGLKKELVGITKFCVHPVSLRKEKAVVGGTKQVHFDKIKALRPDIILCNKEENDRFMVKELEKIAPVHVSDVQNLDDTMNLIQQYGEIFDTVENASSLLENISDAVRRLKDQIRTRPVKKVAYFIWKDPWMLAGKTTFINHLLSINKFENVATEDRYPEVVLNEFLRTAKPELILLSSEPFPFSKKHIRELSEKTDIPVELVDGEYFSWYGSRLLKAFDYFENLRY
ncbi:ABC transporter substrate-binding protein [Spongiivirga citrea]|uniref:ABC transporter substrate-binding protein n=1 Tax=Spongiivirga citrea TaxID=1481457 RepID=A0A6M0CD84_9FLAO|nr:helical backbone metal receptor [Spongiivirga citrea]NER15766.1 ABC transporter substrate-binding protein [Spongiivirga citrea]